MTSKKADDQTLITDPTPATTLIQNGNTPSVTKPENHLEDHGVALSSTATSDLPAITLLVKGQPVRGLIDTGATANLMRPKWATGTLTSITPTTFRMATGGLTFTALHQGILEAITPQQFVIQCPAIIVDNLEADIILGYPWLKEQQANIDLPRGCIHLGIEQRHTLHFGTLSSQNSSATPLDLTNIDINTERWTPSQRETFINTLHEYQMLFQEGETITTTTTTQHQIRLKTDTPIRVRPYQYSPNKKRIIAEQVEEMLATGVIQPSRSRYNSPIHIVEKKDGSPRFCIDYRRLNDATHDEVSPLPPIQESLKDLGTAKIFTTLDMRSGYWQIRMAAESKSYTAFTTPDGGCYEFNVMPFGLKGAPSTFQRLMAQDVLVGYLQDFAIAYLDDIIIFSDTLEDHQRHLRLVFERLSQHGLRLNLQKCHFISNHLDYLGHVVTAHGNHPQTCHVEAIQSALVPKTRKALRGFLGTVNWLRDYIQDCSSILAPMTDLLSVKKPFKWTNEASAAFQAIKEAAAKPLFLSRPDFTQPFVVQTDASAVGASAVLYQESEEQRRIISYASIRFDAAQQKYHINEQECFAVIWAFKRYRAYLEDRMFTLRTDSKALTWLQNFRETKSKLMRWSLLLQEFRYRVEHVPGKNNELPDALSRHPEPEAAPPGLDDVDRLLPKQHHRPPTDQTHQVFLMTDDEPLLHLIQDAQQADPQMQELIASANTPAEGEEPKLIVQDGILRHKVGDRRPIFVPPAGQLPVTYRYHDHYTAGHPGIEETLRAIKERYYWPHMNHFVTDHITNCRICIANKRGPPQTKAPLRAHAPQRPFEVISVDVIGPMNTTRAGNRFGIVAQDLFSRWTEVRAVPNASTERITLFLEGIFQRFGYPMAILTDNGPQFKSRIWETTLRRWQCLQWTTPIYHPRSNPVERRNQDFKKGLRIQLEGKNPDRWDEEVGTVTFNLRCRRNAATGYTSAKALLGYDLHRPGEWRDPLPNQPETHDQRLRQIHANELRYRGRRYAQPDAPMPLQLTPGDFVMVKNHPPPGQHHGPKWLGPYPVMETAGPTSIWVKRPTIPHWVKYHLDQVRPARHEATPSTPGPPAAPELPGGQEPIPGPSCA